MKTNYSDMDEKQLMIEILERHDTIIDLLKKNQTVMNAGFDYVDTVELMRILHISRKTITRWIKNGFLHASIVQHKLFLSLREVNTMMLEHFPKH